MRLLISTFFPRSIYLEGLHTLVDSMATSLVRCGVDTTVLAPLGSRGAGNGNEREYHLVDYLPSQRATGLRTLLRYTQAMGALVSQYDVVQLVDVAPSYLMISERWAARAGAVHSLIEGPAFSWTGVRGQHVSMQHLHHWIVKNRFWTRLTQHRCKAYVVSSGYQREQLVCLGIPPDSVRVIPYGIHPERVRRFDRASAREALGISGREVIGYLGHFSPMKGVPVLLAAFAQLASRDLETTLVLAWSGKGAESPRVLRTIEHMSCRDRIKLLGEVNVSQFLAACDVLVLPYITGSIPHFPLVLIEAFAAETPVITTNVGGLPEIISDRVTGLLVEPGSSNTLTDALLVLLGDAELRDSISRNAYEVFSTALNSDVAAAGLVDLYRESVR